MTRMNERERGRDSSLLLVVVVWVSLILVFVCHCLSMCKIGDEEDCKMRWARVEWVATEREREIRGRSSPWCVKSDSNECHSIDIAVKWIGVGSRVKPRWMQTSSQKDSPNLSVFLSIHCSTTVTASRSSSKCYPPPVRPFNDSLSTRLVLSDSYLLLPISMPLPKQTWITSPLPT